MPPKIKTTTANTAMTAIADKSNIARMKKATKRMTVFYTIPSPSPSPNVRASAAGLHDHNRPVAEAFDCG